MTARALAHSEINRADSEQYGPIELGTVGWEGDPGDHFDIDKSAADGTTLVKVQLLRGRDTTEDHDPTRAQGHKIMARISGATSWRIPEKGTEVAVAFPAGLGEKAGAPFIFAMLGASPSIQFSANRAVLDFGDQSVVIRGKRVTLQDNEGNFVSVSPEGGIQLQSKQGACVVVMGQRIQISDASASSVLIIQPATAELQHKGGGSVVCGGTVTANGPKFVAATATVALGAFASPATPAVYGMTGLAGIGSTTVWVQP